jgi:hypothetical protein
MFLLEHGDKTNDFILLDFFIFYDAFYTVKNIN